MLLLFSLLLSAVNPAPKLYRAIVVDATTSRPIAGVSVLDVQNQVSSITDQQGQFSFPGPSVHFHLRSLGFADLDATRPALAPGQVDTLRLLPERILLSEVSVRPTQLLTLSSLGSKVGKSHGSVVVPGAQFGVLIRPDATIHSAVVQQISVRFSPKIGLEGRVRVRLVAIERGSLSTPSANDLVPIAATYTAAELAALPNHLLTVDLSAYNIRLPATGFFVLVEGLATKAGETYVTDKIVGSMQKGKAILVTATDPQNPTTFHETNIFDYPALSWAPSVTNVETLSRLGYSKPWRVVQEKNSKKAENLDIALTLLAD